MLVWWQEVVGYRALPPLLMRCWVGHPRWPTKRLYYNLSTPFAIKMHLRHSAMFFPLFALHWQRRLCILTVAGRCVELYTVSFRLTHLFVCRTHTAITWGAAGPQSRIGKFKLAQLHLDEHTGLYRNRHYCIHVHAHVALDLLWVVKEYRAMDVNDQSPPTVQEPLEKEIYIKKTEAGAF